MGTSALDLARERVVFDPVRRKSFGDNGTVPSSPFRSVSLSTIGLIPWSADLEVIEDVADGLFQRRRPAPPLVYDASVMEMTVFPSTWHVTCICPLGRHLKVPLHAVPLIPRREDR